MTVPITTLRLPAPLRTEASAYAAALGLSLNALCAVALREYLDARSKGGQAPTMVARPLPVPRPARSPAPSIMPVRDEVPKVGANERCPCGSGEKYKRCHGKPGV